MQHWYTRYYEKMPTAMFEPGRVFILYGPRRTGKTSLVNKCLESYSGKVYTGTGDDIFVKEILGSENVKRIVAAFSGYQLIFIDEAQRIPNVGLGLKILVDHLPQSSIVATGSSSFDLANRLGEPLTGRQKVAVLYPISVLEFAEQFGGMDVHEQLQEFLIYGSYPEVITTSSAVDKKEYLLTLRNSYLFKDILELESIRNSDKLNALLKLLAFQIGKEVSLNELSCNLAIAKQTVARYLDLLEKTFVIKKVSGFARNLRSEVVKTARYYFLDNGVRNAIINNFNDLETRNDVGELWENFCFCERLKRQSYLRIFPNMYFWRTYNRNEIDLVEERDGKLFGYEFKWSYKKIKPPALWHATYPNAQYEVISKENYLAFLT